VSCSSSDREEALLSLTVYAAASLKNKRKQDKQKKTMISSYKYSGFLMSFLFSSVFESAAKAELLLE
jgi:hypothetical protein